MRRLTDWIPAFAVKTVIPDYGVFCETVELDKFQRDYNSPQRCRDRRCVYLDTNLFSVHSASLRWKILKALDSGVRREDDKCTLGGF